MNPFPSELFRVGPVVITDTVLTTLALSVLLVVLGRVVVTSRRLRPAAEIVYDFLETAVTDLSHRDVTPLVPLILTQWLFIGVANLAGIVPEVASPTRDLSLAAALALIAFVAGHVWAAKAQGLRYLRTYVEPSPILLPFNVIGELSRTLALALRLFGNMLSGTLIGAIILYLAGLLVPVPLLMLGLLTGVVQAYIFGVLTLVFAVSSLATATRPPKPPATPSGGDEPVPPQPPTRVKGGTS
jgi:F-type H+-transporting ATPase subunit a